MKNYLIGALDTISRKYHNSSIYEKSMSILKDIYYEKRRSPGSATAWETSQAELGWTDLLVIKLGAYLNSLVVKYKYASYITKVCGNTPDTDDCLCCVKNMFPQIGTIKSPLDSEYTAFFENKTEK